MNDLTTEVIAFRDARDWGQYHTSPQLAAALAIEAAELQELYLWGTEPDLERVAEEVADVMIYALTLAHNYELDIEDVVRAKMAKNAVKYPV
jgi:NTP pyrophosphatase (non-canonical NTP hydrolase)